MATTEIVVSASCVTFNSDVNLLQATIQSLADNYRTAKRQHKLKYLRLDLIDNGPDKANLEVLRKIQYQYQGSFDQINIFSGHGNLGYGGGHNLSINAVNSTFHLIINPDVTLNPDNLGLAIEYMEAHPDVVLLAPNATDENNNMLFLAKRTPQLHVLLARALKLRFLERVFEKDMERYEYRDVMPTNAPYEIELASGCYMFCRSQHLKKIGGFDSTYFMYFEDFDLSIRLRKVGKIIFLPDLKILHYGGNASRKGFRHLVYFSTSMGKFFLRHRFNARDTAR